MQTHKQPKWHVVILGLAIILGAVVRFMPVIMAGFPLNDGGMFYEMIRDLVANGFRLPLFTTYNLAGIPYAYPPFGFYFAGLLVGLFHLPEIELLRWLPSLVNIVSIFAVYLVASVLLKDRPRAALAAALYALTPGGYGWFIMGGGLTRAFGGLFLLLSVYFLFCVFEHGTSREIILATTFSTLAVLSHPEAGLHAAASCALVWIFRGRTRRGTLHASIIALGTLILTSPWWLSVLAGHGAGPFISAFHTGMYQLNPLAALLNNIFSRDTSIPFLLILRLLGLGWAIWKRQYFLLAWMALPYFVEPRSAPAITFFSFNMLIASALADVLPTLFHRLTPGQTGEKPSLEFFERRGLNAVIFLLFFYLFFESALTSFRLINTTLEPSSIEAMTWIRENVPGDAHFFILTGMGDPMIDPVQEWFPALTQRRSQTTLQGYEWTLADGFIPRVKALSEVQSCDSTECLENWSDKTGLDFTHLLVIKEGVSEALLESPSRAGYKLLYQNTEFLVYEK